MDSVSPMESAAVESPYEGLLKAALLIPISHYILGLSLILAVFLYSFLEIHILSDLLTGFRGQRVVLTYNSASKVYRDVVSKCRILHGRYLSTPWLCSPHLQTAFLQFFGNAPVVNYRRQIFMTSDGGTLALDWVKNAEVKEPVRQVNDAVRLDDTTPIIIIIPGLTSDSNSAYVKHLAFNMAKHGWNVVVSNHRGLGGVSITSDCFYNAGWTEDVRKVIDNLHCQYPGAPLFLIGTSIGANIMVKYLAEDGINTPVIGGAAICSPWDLLICDRFINRRLVQRFYNKALTIGLKGYAHMHQAVLSRLSNWDGIKKSRSVRDFDDSATRVLANYEVLKISILFVLANFRLLDPFHISQTVDTYYRRASCSNFVGSVMVPLLCVSSLDDPVCTSEAIPWDECRSNPNVVLATTQHGGHLPFYEGLTAKTVWWVRAVEEFFGALQFSPLSQQKKEIPVSSVNPLETSIDQAPYVHVLEDGMVTALSDEVAETDQIKTEDATPPGAVSVEKQNTEIELTKSPEITNSPKRDGKDIVAPVMKCLNQLTCQNRKSFWLLTYIAIVTTWPVVGPTLVVFFRKRFQHLFSWSALKR